MSSSKTTLLTRIAVVLLLGGTVACGPCASYKPGMAHDSEQLRATLQPPAGAVGPQYIQVTNDMRLYYEKVGSGAPVLFIHGGPGIPAQPEGGLRKLKGFTTYFYHARGAGKSTRPIQRFKEKSWTKNPPLLERKLGASAQIADIERIRRALGVKKLRLVGLSYGGLLATLFAAEFPDSVHSLVLINPAPLQFDGSNKNDDLFARIGAMQPNQKLKQEYEAYMKKFMGTFGNIWEQDEDSLTKLFMKMGPFYAHAARKQGMKLPSKIPDEWMSGWHSFALFFSMGRKYDHTGFVKSRLKVPVLLLLGDNDITPLKHYKSYRDSLPRSFKEVVLPGAGHFPHIDNPDRFAKEVVGFLRQ